MSLAETYCICGAAMELIVTAIMEGSDLKCYWLKCTRCNKLSDPAITERETRLYWEYYKMH